MMSLSWLSPSHAMPRNASHLLIAGACIATTGLSLYYLSRRLKQIQWIESVATITDLYVYPIKSVAGLQVPTLTVTPEGVSFGEFQDRFMTLLTRESRGITQRQEPRLALIKSKLSKDGLAIILSAPGMEEMAVMPKKTVSPADQILKFTIWSMPTEGAEVSQVCSQWFSKFLGEEVTLVQHMPSFTKRGSQLESKNGMINDYKIQILYQDRCPLHIVTESSIEAADKLRPADDSAKIDVRNFRANIVMRGPVAHEEEKWLFVRMNGIVCKRAKICNRCSIPTVDQDKGIKVHSKTETLKSFRSPVNEFERKNYDTSPIFGLNLAPESSGCVSIGMTVDAARQ